MNFNVRTIALSLLLLATGFCMGFFGRRYTSSSGKRATTQSRLRHTLQAEAEREELMASVTIDKAGLATQHENYNRLCDESERNLKESCEAGYIEACTWIVRHKGERAGESIIAKAFALCQESDDKSCLGLQQSLSDSPLLESMKNAALKRCQNGIASSCERMRYYFGDQSEPNSIALDKMETLCKNNDATACIGLFEEYLTRVDGDEKRKQTKAKIISLCKANDLFACEWTFEAFHVAYDEIPAALPNARALCELGHISICGKLMEKFVQEESEEYQFARKQLLSKCQAKDVMACVELFPRIHPRDESDKRLVLPITQQACREHHGAACFIAGQLYAGTCQTYDQFRFAESVEQAIHF